MHLEPRRLESSGELGWRILDVGEPSEPWRPLLTLEGQGHLPGDVDGKARFARLTYHILASGTFSTVFLLIHTAPHISPFHH